jgi:hypothetical protein
VQTFIKALPTSINKNAMSTYDMIVEEGVEQGRKKTLEQITREMLLKGLDYNFIIEILHVESEFIDSVREALLLEQEGLSPEDISND